MSRSDEQVSRLHHIPEEQVFSERDAATPESSGVFWRRARPETFAALDRHNRRVGTAWQRLLHRLFTVYLVGPIAYLVVRALFRVRVRGAEVRDGIEGHCIYAYRHFYEWDPLLLYYGSMWLRSLRRPHLHPNALSGHAWMRTRLRRLLSLCFGTIGVARGLGRDQSGMRRAAALLRGRKPATVSVAPTGPIGRATRFEVRPGVGHLAIECPDVPVIPITVVGVQGISWRRVLRLRRPEISIRFGPGFRAGDLPGRSDEERALAVCERLREEWRRLEAEP